MERVRLYVIDEPADGPPRVVEVEAAAGPKTFRLGADDTDRHEMFQRLGLDRWPSGWRGRWAIPRAELPPGVGTSRAGMLDKVRRAAKLRLDQAAAELIEARKRYRAILDLWAAES